MMNSRFTRKSPFQQKRSTFAAVAGGSFFFFALASITLLFSGFGDRSEVVVKQPERSATVETSIKMTDVLVPVQKIEPGEPLRPGLFRKEARPQIGVSNGSLRDFEQIQNMYAKLLIVPGQALHRDYITSKRPSSNVSRVIPNGFRAVAIRVDATTSVEGFARPGSRVDVQWTHRVNGQPAIISIVENAKVLSAERVTEVQAGSHAGVVPSTVTLLATADDARRIQLASTTGKLTLSLRGDEDFSADPGSTIITIPSLLGEGAPVDSERPEAVVLIDGEKWALYEGRLKPVKE